MWYVRPAKAQTSLRIRAVCAYAQSDQSLYESLGFSMTVKLPTEHHLEFLSLKGGFTGSSEFTQSCQNTTLLEITCLGSYVTYKNDGSRFLVYKL